MCLQWRSYETGVEKATLNCGGYGQVRRKECPEITYMASGVAGGGVRVVSEEGRGSGAVPLGKFFIFLPETMGFCKISCARKITTQKNRCRMRD